MPEALIQLQLDEDVSHDVKRILCQRNRDAVAGASVRDQQLMILDDQLEGRLQPYGDKRWRGACTLNDPASLETHVQLLALFRQAQAKDPKWEVIEVDPADADNAMLQEAWLTNKASQYKLNLHLYNVAYNLLRDPCGVMFVGWKQTVRMKRSMRFRDTEFPDLPLVGADEKEEDREYEEQLVEEPEVEHQGCEFRTPDLADVYVYPADCQDLKQALGIAERMFLTEDQLLDGVEDYGYDEEEVERLIRLGPTHSLDGERLREHRNIYDGTVSAPTEPKDGFYECFLWFGKCPRLRDDDGYRIPEQYLHDDLMCMICPDRDVVFQMDISPYADKPYIFFYMLGRPNRLYGKGAMQLIATLQEEATANLQLTIDGMNLQMSPVLVAPPEWIQKYNNWSIYPGAILPEEEQGSLRPLEWGHKAEAGLALQQAIDGRIKGVTAAQGFGQINDKQPLVAEMQGVMAAVDTKFDLFLFGMSVGMEELAARIVSLHLQFEGEGLEETFRYNGEEKKISAQQMRGRYRYVATATSATLTPESRQKMDMAKVQVQMGYIQALLSLPPPVMSQFAPLLWHGARQTLMAMGERQPESWIGPQPQQQSQGIPPEVQAMIAAGVPPQQIMAAIGGQGAPPQGGAPTPQGMPSQGQVPQAGAFPQPGLPPIPAMPQNGVSPVIPAQPVI